MSLENNFPSSNQTVVEKIDEKIFDESIQKIKEKFEQNNIEKLEMFVKIFPLIYQTLPAEEKQKYLEDPIRFVSNKLYFRGVSNFLTKELLQVKEMQPKNGEMGGKAVYLTNKPITALEYINKEDSLIVFDPSKTLYQLINQKLLRPGSEKYKNYYQKKLNSLTNQAEKDSLMWDFQNKIDSIYPDINYALDPNDDNNLKNEPCTIQLSQAQPLSAIKFIITLYPDGEAKIFNPNNKNELNQIIKIYQIN